MKNCYKIQCTPGVEIKIPMHQDIRLFTCFGYCIPWQKISLSPCVALDFETYGEDIGIEDKLRALSYSKKGGRGIRN